MRATLGMLVEFMEGVLCTYNIKKNFEVQKELRTYELHLRKRISAKKKIFARDENKIKFWRSVCCEAVILCINRCRFEAFDASEAREIVLREF